MLEKVNLYYGKMDNFSRSILSNKGKKKYFAVNTDCYNIASRDQEYKQILLDSKNRIYVDGAGILMGQKMTNSKVAEERISTTDLFVNLLEKSSGHTFYLLGGSYGTAEKVIANMQNKYPNAKFVGFHHGYFEKENSGGVIEEINKKNPDILLIGFGCPVQEKWVTKHFDEINAINFITCGGLFDYYAENVIRAPRWMQKLSMEWFFRFLQEPNRLFKRYFIGNTKFLISVILKRLKKEKI